MRAGSRKGRRIEIAAGKIVGDRTQAQGKPHSKQSPIAIGLSRRRDFARDSSGIDRAMNLWRDAAAARVEVGRRFQNGTLP
jgi:hypothetical protein